MKLEIEIPEFKTNAEECYEELGEEFYKKIVEPIDKFFEKWTLPNGDKCIFIDAGYWDDGLLGLGILFLPSRFNIYDEGGINFNFYANGMGSIEDGSKKQEMNWEEILRNIIGLLVSEFKEINDKSKIESISKVIDFLKL